MTESARARIHAMFPLDADAAAELDTRLDVLVAGTLRHAADLAEQRTGSLAEQRVLLDFATQLRREANTQAGQTLDAPGATR